MGCGKAGDSPPDLLEGAMGKGGEPRWVARRTSPRCPCHLGHGHVGVKRGKLDEGNVEIMVEEGGVLKEGGDR